MLTPVPIPTKSHLTVRRVGNTITVYINGRRVGSATDATPHPATGKVGLEVAFDMTTAYDNFVVRR